MTRRHAVSAARVVGAAFVLVVGSGSGSCGGTPSCPAEFELGLRADALHTVSLDRAASASSHPELPDLPSCGGLDGLATGGVIRLRTTSNIGEHSCELGVTVEEPTLAFTPRGFMSSPFVSPAVDVTQNVSFSDGCTGEWQLVLDSLPGDAGMAGGIALRRFATTSPDACAARIGRTVSACADSWFISVDDGV